MLLKENKLFIIPFILLTIVTTVAAQILVKFGINRFPDLDFKTQLFWTYFKLFTSPPILFGFVLYFIGALMWMYALSKTDISFAYPFFALSHVLILVTSKFLLDEQIPSVRWIGIGVICAGLIIISRS